MIISADLKVVQPVQAVPVSGDPQSLCLWCQFASVFSDYTVTWSIEGTVLAEIKRRYSVSIYIFFYNITNIGWSPELFTDLQYNQIWVRKS